MKKIISIILNILLEIGTPHFALAQNKNILPLIKGDQLPEMNVMIRQENQISSVNLSQYRGKLVLFDFWGTNCLNCIAALPEMVELQKKFDRDLKIIVVTENTGEEINTLFNKFKNNRKASIWVDAAAKLPFITSDTIFQILFPHKSLPTHVWITSDQKLLSVAYPSSTTEQNIQQLLDNKEVVFDEPRILDLDRKDPLSWLDKSKAIIPLLEYYSFLTKRIEIGMGGFTEINWIYDSATKKNAGVAILNKSLMDLYKFAYSEKIPVRPAIPNQRISIRLSDTTRFNPPDVEIDYYKWANDNVFSYVLKLPATSQENIFSYLAKDLDKLFGYRSFIENKKTLCWVLKKNRAEIKFKFIKGDKVYKAEDTLIIKGFRMETLYNILSELFLSEKIVLPFFDFTSYAGKIDIKIPWQNKGKLPAIESVNKELTKYGLTLAKEYRNIPILVIKD